MLVMHGARSRNPHAQGHTVYFLPSCKAWGRQREQTSLLSGVSLGPAAECGMYTCNCSGSGGGWTFDGWDLSAAPLKPRESFAAQAELGTCVGPQAFDVGQVEDPLGAERLVEQRGAHRRVDAAAHEAEHHEEERDAEPDGRDLGPRCERETSEPHDRERARERREGEVLVGEARTEEHGLAQRVGRDERRADGGPPKEAARYFACGGVGGDEEGRGGTREAEEEEGGGAAQQRSAAEQPQQQRARGGQVAARDVARTQYLAGDGGRLGGEDEKNPHLQARGCSLEAWGCSLGVRGCNLGARGCSLGAWGCGRAAAAP